METDKLQKAISQVSERIENISIGIQKEKILHKILKYYIEPNNKFHEIKVGNLYADVLVNNHIYEIQTQNFNMLRKKLTLFLNDYHVTIVYPTSRIKKIYSINENGEFLREQKSPKKGTVFQVLVELYKIKSFINHPNLDIKVIYMDIDEYRTVVPKIHYRSKGYVRFKQVPNYIVKEYDLKNSTDYLKILTSEMDKKLFTVNDFSKTFKLSYNKASSAIQVLKELNIIEIEKKEGRKNIWKIKTNI